MAVGTIVTTSLRYLQLLVVRPVVAAVASIMVIVFYQFLIRNVPLLARVLIQLLVLVALVHHPMFVVRVEIMIWRVFRMVLFILLLIMTLIISDLELDFLGSAAL